MGAKGGCNDAAWPDGVGGIMRAGEGTAWTVDELVAQMNQVGEGEW